MFIKTSILVMKDLNSLVAFLHTWDSIWHTENTMEVSVTILALKFNQVQINSTCKGRIPPTLQFPESQR